MDKSKKIALIGPPNAGKSTLLHTLKKLGFLTFSADDIVRDIWCVDNFGGKKEICGYFGIKDAHFLKNKIHKHLKEVADLKFLESILHQKVKASLNQFITTTRSNPYIICEIPLLFEANLAELFDHIIYVYPPVRRHKAFNMATHSDSCLTLRQIKNNYISFFEGLKTPKYPLRLDENDGNNSPTKDSKRGRTQSVDNHTKTNAFKLTLKKYLKHQQHNWLKINKFEPIPVKQLASSQWQTVIANHGSLRGIDVAGDRTYCLKALYNSKTMQRYNPLARLMLRRQVHQANKIAAASAVIRLH